MVKKNLLSLFIALIIIFLSFSGPATFNKLSIPLIPHLDKIVHSIMYFIFMLSLVFENRLLLTSTKRYFILGTIPVIFGAMIEILQPLLTKSRTGDFFDGCFNTIGVVLAILAWIIFKQLHNPETK
jgi:hypothetical protein